MKFELFGEVRILEGVAFRRIRALRDIPSAGVMAGDVGGWLDDWARLDQSGAARVYGDAHWLSVGPLGSRQSTLTVTIDAQIGLRLTTGCFSGSIAEFEAAVTATHGDNEHAIHYRAAIALIRARFPGQTKAEAA